MTNISLRATTALAGVLSETREYLSPVDETLIIEGYYELLNSVGPQYGLEASFLMQSLDTVLHLAKWGLEAKFLTCALLYYPLTTGAVSIEQVRDKFGGNAANVADTMLVIARNFESDFPWYRLSDKASSRKKEYSRSAKQPKKTSRQDKRAGNLITIAFLASARVPEIAVLRLVDRRYQLKWSEELTQESDIRQNLAQQSIDVYADVAETLGIWSVKWKLEDDAFKILQPHTYETIAKNLENKREEREDMINRATSSLLKELSAAGLRAEVCGRPKHIYSIYRKMQRTGSSIEELNDIIGLRIILSNIEDCYAAFSILVKNWPVPEGIYEESENHRDWIANPKPNGYQSIHTAVIFENRLLEVQIRTQEMHDLAEYGAAAHWVYKRTGKSLRLFYEKYVEQIAEMRRAWESRDNYLDLPTYN